MRNLIISKPTEKKLLNKHSVTPREVEQCFENCEGSHLIDEREQHKTDPPTKWFIAETNARRLLKVVFVFQDGQAHIKTAYEANAEEIRIYNFHSKRA